MEFRDYASNKRKPAKERFCSRECRATWTGIANSIRLGGDGKKKGKSQRDGLYYRANAKAIRKKRRQYYEANRSAILSKKATADRNEKKAVVAAYGGKCICCGESHWELLTIDHVNGDGHLHRRKVGKGRRIYKDLARLGYPKEGYRLLCFNCNISRGFYGYCPHQPHDKQKCDKRPLGNAGRPRTVV